MHHLIAGKPSPAPGQKISFLLLGQADEGHCCSDCRGMLWERNSLGYAVTRAAFSAWNGPAVNRPFQAPRPML